MLSSNAHAFNAMFYPPEPEPVASASGEAHADMYVPPSLQAYLPASLQSYYVCWHLAGHKRPTPPPAAQQPCAACESLPACVQVAVSPAQSWPQPSGSWTSRTETRSEYKLSQAYPSQAPVTLNHARKSRHCSQAGGSRSSMGAPEHGSAAAMHADSNDASQG
eukprot:366546-Chlamydomonas_euryale.AAC.45